MKIVIQTIIFSVVAVFATNVGAQSLGEGLCTSVRYIGYSDRDFSRFHSGGPSGFLTFANSICRSGAPVSCVLDHLNDERLQGISGENRIVEFVKANCTNEKIECALNHVNDERFAGIPSSGQRMDIITEHCESDSIECVLSVSGETEGRVSTLSATRICGLSTSENIKSCLVSSLSADPDLSGNEAQSNCLRCNNDMACVNYVTANSISRDLCPYNSQTNFAYLKPRNGWGSGLARLISGGNSFNELLAAGNIEMRNCNGTSTTGTTVRPQGISVETSSGSSLDD